MTDTPWLTIIGLGEDGTEGLSSAARAALDAAQIIMAPPRHLSLIPDSAAEIVPWPVPFADGIPLLLAHRGTPVVALASGDPFWFGAGSVLARHLSPHEWRALPSPSCFSLAASRLGWPLETTRCLGLHAAPLGRLRPDLAEGARLIVTLRDGAAVADLAGYLTAEGFGASQLHILEALGGPREAITSTTANALPQRDFTHPLAVAIEPAGGVAFPLASGRADDWFDSDGQMTKRPVRALALSALAPRHGEHLWDIGGGSGSIGIEWLLSHSSLSATAIEPREDRAERIRANAAKLGVDRLHVVHGAAPGALAGLPPPDAVFIGGGLSQDLLDHLAQTAKGARIVAHAVTLESEALLTQAQADHGGDLLRIELAQVGAIGPRRGWKSAYPIVQWSAVL